jgi:predicted O-linked N-acetylglucosamine transferase (SPINDLY family)
MVSINEVERLFNEALDYINISSFEKAEIKLEKAYKLLPKKISIILNLSSVLINLKKLDKAYSILNLGIEEHPKNTDILLNIATILMLKKKFSEAIEIVNQIKEIDPKINEAYAKLASCYSNTGQVDKAVTNYEKSFELSPNYKILSSLIFCSNFKNDYSNKKNIEFINKFKFYIPKINEKNLLPFNYEKKNRFNLGFVSGDLRNNHPVGNCLYDFFKEIRNYFNIYAYYNNIEIDNSTNDFKILFNKWENIQKDNDIEVINKIRTEKIDLLIDLSGHTDKNRLPVFAQKAAPIQITWCGYLNSTGLDEIDYIIGDPYTTPVSDQTLYSEKILQMPEIWHCCSIPSYKDLKINLNTPAIKNKHITFGSFNQLNKINIEVIELWSNILKEIPSSKIIIKNRQLDDTETKKRICNIFLNQGINNKQLLLSGSVNSRKDLLMEYNNIDISLDTFPYNGMSTSFESIFMGVPVLSLKGNRFLSNCGISINKNINMHEWIAEDKGDYLEKSIYFSKNLDKLNFSRKTLHEKALKSILFNSKKFSEDFYKIVNNLLLNK